MSSLPPNARGENDDSIVFVNESGGSHSYGNNDGNENGNGNNGSNNGNNGNNGNGNGNDNDNDSDENHSTTSNMDEDEVFPPTDLEPTESQLMRDLSQPVLRMRSNQIMAIIEAADTDESGELRRSGSLNSDAAGGDGNAETHSDDERPQFVDHDDDEPKRADSDALKPASSGALAVALTAAVGGTNNEGTSPTAKARSVGAFAVPFASPASSSSNRSDRNVAMNKKDAFTLAMNPSQFSSNAARPRSTNKNARNSGRSVGAHRVTNNSADTGSLTKSVAVHRDSSSTAASADRAAKDALAVDQARTSVVGAVPSMSLKGDAKEKKESGDRKSSVSISSYSKTIMDDSEAFSSAGMGIPQDDDVSNDASNATNLFGRPATPAIRSRSAGLRDALSTNPAIAEHLDGHMQELRDSMANQEQFVDLEGMAMGDDNTTAVEAVAVNDSELLQIARDEVMENAVEAQVVTQQEQEKTIELAAAQRGKQQQRKYAIVLALALVAVIALAIGLSVGLEGSGSGSALIAINITMVPTESPTTATPTQLPSASPSNAPTLAPTWSAEASQLLDFIRSSSPQTTVDQLDVENTPQAKAFDWLIEDQKTRRAFNADGKGWTQGDLAVRYALAVFYYSTGGDGWFVKEDWMALGMHHCEWGGSITCGNSPTIQPLQKISMSGNNLAGTLPDELAMLSLLDTLTLSGNSLSGSIPTSMATIQSMAYMVLSNNMLEGPLFPNDEWEPVMKNWQNTLLEFDLSQNTFTGDFPAGLRHLKSVVNIQLQNNALNGTIATEIGLMESLEEIDLSRSSFSENATIPSEIGMLDSLQKFIMISSNIGGTIPTELGLLKDLQLLKINRNKRIEGMIPPHIGNMTSLETLSLGSNKLVGPIPEEIGQLINLEEIEFDNNRLTSWPESLFENLTKLRILNLRRNQIRSSLPPSIGNLTDLQVFSFETNPISGSLPSEIGLSWDRLAPGLTRDLTVHSAYTVLGTQDRYCDERLPHTRCVVELQSLRCSPSSSCTPATYPPRHPAEHASVLKHIHVNGSVTALWVMILEDCMRAGSPRHVAAQQRTAEVRQHEPHLFTRSSYQW